MRIFAYFLLNQVTGESEFRPAAAHFSSILSVENRGGSLWPILRSSLPDRNRIRELPCLIHDQNSLV
jgi:hypothetical protein